MHVTQFMGHVQTNFNNTMRKAVENFHNTRIKVVEKINHTKNKSVENLINTVNKVRDLKNFSKDWVSTQYAAVEDKWHGEIKPYLLDNYFRPLDTPFDKAYIIAAAILAIASAILIPLWIGKAAIPIAICASTFIIGTAYTMAKTRLCWHFNRMAITEIDPVLEELNATTVQTREESLTKISELITKLSKPQYSHLKEELKKIEEQFEPYRNEVNKANGGHHFDESKQVFVDELERFKIKITPFF
ncbi:MAG: hypothetical protein H0V82_06430 [Candidatus Protochlamydia sp.]|nr:hypothetical protein [Candidatus Protochlamydia sp.]